jgi:hypothetical protein
VGAPQTGIAPTQTSSTEVALAKSARPPPLVKRFRCPPLLLQRESLPIPDHTVLPQPFDITEKPVFMDGH